MDVHLIPGNRVSYDGGTFEAKRPDKGIIPPLARHLIEQGCDPETKLSVYREGNLVFKPVPLSRWASVSVSESPKQCAKIVKYQPFPQDLNKDE